MKDFFSQRVLHGFYADYLKLLRGLINVVTSPIFSASINFDPFGIAILDLLNMNENFINPAEIGIHHTEIHPHNGPAKQPLLRFVSLAAYGVPLDGWP